MDEFLTVRELSRFLKISKTTIYRLIQKREIPFYRFNGVIRFFKKDIERWASLQKNEPIPKTQSYCIIDYDGNSSIKELEMAKKIVPYGRVYQRRSKRGVVWYCDYRLKGKRIRHKLLAITQEQAIAELQKEIMEAIDDELGLRKRPILFKDFAVEFLSKYSRVFNKSWKTSEVRMRKLIKFFGSKSLDSITVYDIQSFVARELREGLKKSTVNRELALLKKAFNVGIEWGYCKENPVRKIKLFSEREFQKGWVLTPEEEQRLLNSCSPHLKPLVVFLLNTGCRVGEALSLRWENIDFRNRTIKIELSKSGRKREIPMNSVVFSLLKELKVKSPSFYVFSYPDGRPLRNIRTAWKLTTRRANLRGLRLHDLRHTFCSRLVERGVDLSVVKELAGHQDIRTTQRYLHPLTSHKRQAVEVLTQIGHKFFEDGVNSLQESNYES